MPMIGIFPIPRIVVAYAVWLVTLALSAALFMVWRSALLQLYLRAQLDKWAFRFFDNAATVFLGLVWLIVVIATESWFRQLANSGRLRRTAGRFLLGEAVAVVVGYLIYTLA